MKILIIYDTYSGGTLDAAQFVYDTLSKKGQSVTIKRSGEITPDDLSVHDFIIFGTPSWFVDNVEGNPHASLLKLMKQAKDLNLTNKKIAIFGLGDETYAHFCGGVDFLEKFVIKQGGKISIESLKLNNYYANLEDCHQKLSSWIETLPLST